MKVEKRMLCPPVDWEPLKAAGLLHFEPKPGSIQVPCATCTQLVWLGPGQQEKIKTDTSFVIVCMVCLIKEKQNNPSAEIRVNCCTKTGATYRTTRDN